MPVSFNSPARNLFLLGSTGTQVVTNFFKTIDLSAGTDGVYIPDEIKYNNLDQKYILAGTAQHNNFKEFGWFEKRNTEGALDWNVNVEATSSVNTTLRALELDINNNLTVVGKTGDIPWIAKYSNGGVIDWQSTTNSANVEYTGITSDANGNYYACGNTPTTGEAQAFVEKFDASGNPGWGKSAFMLGRDVVLNKVAANTRGEVVAVGYLEDDSKNKGYIVKIDTNTGEVLWDRTLQTEKFLSGSPTVVRPCLCEDVYIDSKDQIYVVGRLFSVSNSIGFIVKYSAEGNIIWQRETPEEETFEYYQVKSDGETEQTIVFGKYFDSNLNKIGGVLTKYTKNGNVVWRRKILSSFGSIRNPVNLDADPSFYYFLYTDENTNESFGDPDRYTFGKVSSTGNGLGAFQYDEGTGQTIDYEILTIQDKIGRISDGSVRNDSSDLITYPFNANQILFDDLATQVSNKKRQMDTADSFEYSGSPAIRVADFQELNLLGDVYSGSGNWLDQSGKGNDGVVNGAIHNAAGYWEFDGTDKKIIVDDENLRTIGFGSHAIEVWVRPQEKIEEDFIGTGTGTGAVLLMFFSQAGGGNGGFRGHSWSTSASNTIDSPISPAVNVWRHVVQVVDYDGGTIKLYEDGVETASLSLSGSAPTTHYDLGKKFVIGSRYSNVTTSSNINGDIGEVRVYPRALTPAQVFQNYNATKSKYINEAPSIAPKLTNKNVIIDNNLLLYYDFGNRATYDRVENLYKWSNNFNKTGDVLDFWGTGNNITYLPKSGPNGEDVWELTLNQYTGGLEGEASIQQRILPVYPAGTATSQRWLMRSAPGYGTQTVYHKHGRNAVYGVNQANVEFNITEEWSAITTTDSIFNSNTKEFFGIGTVNANVRVQIASAQLWIGSGNTRYIDTSGVRITSPTKVNNLASTSYSSTISGPTFNSNGWFVYDSLSEAINGPTAASNILGTGTTTILFWCKQSSWSNRMIQADSGSAQTSDWYFSNYTSGSNYFFSLQHTAGGRNIGAGSTDLTNTWLMILLSLDSSGNLEMVAYRAATPTTFQSFGGEFPSTYTPGTNLGSSAPLKLGGFTVGSLEMGEVLVYNRTLTLNERLRNFNATRAKYGV